PQTVTPFLLVHFNLLGLAMQSAIPGPQKPPERKSGLVGRCRASAPCYELRLSKNPKLHEFPRKSPLFSIALFSGADFFDSLASRHKADWRTPVVLLPPSEVYSTRRLSTSSPSSSLPVYSNPNF